MARVNVPQTFERRGTTVPLMVPDFAHTRVREYINGDDRVLEAVIPNYSGARRGEMTVVNWNQLDELATFGDRDLRIIEEVGKTSTAKQIDPIEIRTICMRADADLHPDQYRRNQARLARTQDNEDQETVRLSCIAQLTRECGIDRGDVFMANANTKTLVDLITNKKSEFDIELLVERIMVFAAERSGRSLDEIRDWLEPLVSMIAPLGTVAAAGEQRGNGHLFAAHIRLIEFRKALSRFKVYARDEVGQSIGLVLQVTDQSIEFINERLEQLDRMLGKFADMFEGYDDSILKLEKLRRDIAFALDGWEELIVAWEEAEEGMDMAGGEQAVERAIYHIMNFLPVIPDKELYPDDTIGGTGVDVERARQSLVHEMHSWSTNAVDHELQARIKEAKERDGA
ncbi:MAG: hypothetical protein HOL85_23200 [Rhodospirillaceae bacterium]|jgi:hypothetical protein|nr:hypothetical protein [Rhodospirillaceae bacterium]MBT6136371.1 hypothetical protein [Rhodospirillaceae bacterium]